MAGFQKQGQPTGWLGWLSTTPLPIIVPIIVSIIVPVIIRIIVPVQRLREGLDSGRARAPILPILSTVVCISKWTNLVLRGKWPILDLA